MVSKGNAIKNESKCYTGKEIAQICDHTFLKSSEEFKKETGFGESPVRKREKEFCHFLENIKKLSFKPYSICVRAADIPHAAHYLKKAKMDFPLVATVGFPEGHWYLPNYKLFEAEFAMAEGASEIDMTLNYQALKEGSHGFVLQEVQSIVKAVHQQGGKVKLILETSELTLQQIAQACHLAAHSGVDFVKTSTGFGSYGAQLEQLETMCRNFQGGIKISGGITMDNVQTFLSVIHSVRGKEFKLSPESIRIGESLLLYSL